MKVVGTKLDNSEYEIFDFCCKENGLTKSEQLRDIIKNFVNAEKEHEQIKDTAPTVADPELKPIVEMVFD